MVERQRNTREMTIWCQNCKRKVISEILLFLYINYDQNVILAEAEQSELK